MKPEDSIRYSLTDVWLLLSIAMCSRLNGATLEDVISVGDYINHAIFKTQEIRIGTGKLIAGGKITCEDGKFRLTDQMQADWDAIEKSSKMPSKWFAKLEANLRVDRAERMADAEEEKWAFDGINEEMVTLAVEEYLRKF